MPCSSSSRASAGRGRCASCCRRRSRCTGRCSPTSRASPRRPRPGARRASSSRSTRSPTCALIEALVAAGQAGREIDLIVRGACILPPGIAGRHRSHPRPLDRRPLPRAFARRLLPLGRRRRRRGGLPLERRLDGSQHVRPGRGRLAGARRRRCASASSTNASFRICTTPRDAWLLRSDGTYHRGRRTASVSAQQALMRRYDAGRMTMDLILWRHAEAEDARRRRRPRPGADRARPRARPSAWRRGSRRACRRRRASSPARRCAARRRSRRSAGRRRRSTRSARARAREAVLAAAGWPDEAGAVVVVGHQPTLGLAAALALGEGDVAWQIEQGRGLLAARQGRRRRRALHAVAVARRSLAAGPSTAAGISRRRPRRRRGASASPVFDHASTSSRSRCSARGCGSAQPARQSDRRRAVVDAQRDRVGIDVVARVAGDHREAQAEQVQREARRPAAPPPSCAGRRAGRGRAGRCGAAGSARSRRRRRGRAGRRCGDGDRGARSSFPPRAARPPRPARGAPSSLPRAGAVEQRERRRRRRAAPGRRRPRSDAAARAPSRRAGRRRRRGARPSARAARSKITPWRSAPRAGLSSAMPKCVASV